MAAFEPDLWKIKTLAPPCPGKGSPPTSPGAPGHHLTTLALPAPLPRHQAGLFLLGGGRCYGKYNNRSKN